MNLVFVGIDVSKKRLDVHVRLETDKTASAEEKHNASFANDPAGIEQLRLWLQSWSIARIVLEATGGYETAVLTTLAEQQLPIVRVNPRQVRQFARASGRSAKTDRLDAASLAHFAQALEPEVRPLPSLLLRQLRELLERRQQLLTMRVMEHNRYKQAQELKVKQSLKKHLRHLRGLFKEVEQQLNDRLDQAEELRVAAEFLRSIPGIGPQVSRTLLIALPELGKVEPKKLTSLVGLAPFNHDSGTYRGVRRIWGGRRVVRVALYQAAVCAVRCNPAMQQFYQRLLSKGKAKKLALTAVARKLLLVAHALLRKQERWQANSVLPA